jgi:hypothetical protein
MTRRLPLALLTVALSVGGRAHPATAHESQPGTLEPKQVATDRYEVTWRAPIFYGGRTRHVWNCPTTGRPSSNRRSNCSPIRRSSEAS